MIKEKKGMIENMGSVHMFSMFMFWENKDKEFV
jgi:hypothetical protein